MSSQCPKCGRTLEKYDGKIGYCPQHHWVSPPGKGYDNLAAERNRQEEEALRKSRLEKERQEQEEQERQQQEAHRSALRIAMVVVVAICLIVAAAVLFVVRPNIQYQQATKLFADGEYAKAQTKYESLSGHKDAKQRAVLSAAMVDLSENHTEEAIEKFDSLLSGGDSAVSKQLADAFLPVISNWKEKHLPPQVLLMLLQRIDHIDPQNTLDSESLLALAHVELLPDKEEIRSSYLADVNNDSQKELITLLNSCEVKVHHLDADKSQPMTVDNQIIADALMKFGEDYRQSDTDDSVSCFEKAYALQPDAQTRAALTQAYQDQAKKYEAQGDQEAALSSSYKALKTANTQESFVFYYDMNLRLSTRGQDTAQAIGSWSCFAVENETEINTFGALEKWKHDAAELYIRYAKELAAANDGGCLTQLQLAKQHGADIQPVLDELYSYFSYGLIRAKLRLMEYNQAQDDKERQSKIRASMEEEVRKAIIEWKALGVSASDVPALVYFSNVHQIEIGAADLNAIYREAALQAAGSVIYSAFVNWDNDAYEELLTLDAQGLLGFYGVRETWQRLSEIQTGLPNAGWLIPDHSIPVILILSSNKDEFLVTTVSSNILSVLFREKEISRLTIDQSTLTYSRELPGSIVRRHNFIYRASVTENRPERVGVDWQQNDYPSPVSAQDAIQRYFEARCYDIPEEVSTLVYTDANEQLFQQISLAQLPVPVSFNEVSIVPYFISDNQAMFEVSYAAKDRKVLAYIKVAHQGIWKLIGAADSFVDGLSVTEIDFSAPILCTGLKTSGSMEKRNETHTYRLMLSTSGRLSFQWEASEKNLKDAYGVTLRKSQEDKEPLDDYLVSLNVFKQKRLPIILPAGIYYLTVKANSRELLPYRFTAIMKPDTFVEKERNDTAITATPIHLNTAYAGQLLTKNDVDYYTFTLEEDSAVNVRMTTKGIDIKSNCFQFAVLNRSGSAVLADITVPGNVLLSETDRLYLAKGKYLLRMQKSSSHTTAEYQLTVFAEPAIHTEVEYNNTMETASPLSLNQDFQGSFGIERDIDYYVFTLREHAVIQPRFTFNPLDNNSKAYELTVLNTMKVPLIKETFKGKETSKVVAPLALSAGTYYIKLENPQFVRQGYVLHLVSIGVDAVENEPNDSAALATDLALGQIRTGVLTTSADIDYYKLSFSERSTVTLAFRFPQSENKNKVYVITIEQNGKTLWSANLEGNSGGLEQQLEFPAGEYYIKIKASAWLDSVYTITVK